MRKKIKILISFLILMGIITGVYFGFLKEEKPKYSLVKVFRAEISQEVSETGTIKMGEEIKLSFKNPGRIQEIYVKTGDEVKLGENLAKLDTAQLSIQLKEAQAALEIAQAQLKKLFAGASPEEIKIAETSVSNAESSLKNAQQHLEDVKILAEGSLNDAYEDALNVLDDAYLKSLNAFETTRLVQVTYFTKNDQEGIRVRDSKSKIEASLNQIKFYLDKAKTDSKKENIDLALSETKKALNNILDNLVIIRQTCEDPSYRDVVPTTDKNSLDTHKTNINTALTNVTNSQQTISSAKLTNDSNINTAQTQVEAAEGVLKTAQDKLAQLLAPPRQEDIDLSKAKIKQAEAQITLLQTQIGESTITSPTAGKIKDIQKREGESVQFGEPIISFLPLNPFQVEVDIYEEDIVKIKVGNLAEIKLVAFPEKTLKGNVSFIEPAEKIIEGVVYYEVTIDFEEPPQEIKPGMTTDVIIKTASKENVLIIPEAAINEKDGKKIVGVLKGKNFEERVIEIGLKGNNDMVEVISGLEEGEQVLIK